MSERTIRCTPAESATSLVLEAVVHAVGDRPVVVERGEDLADRGQDRVDAAHVEEGLLLAGERRVRQVLGGGARPDREATPPGRSPRPGGRRPRGCPPRGRRGTPARPPRPGSPCRPRRGGARRRCRGPSSSAVDPLGEAGVADEATGTPRRWSRSRRGRARPRSARWETISPREAFLPPTSSRSSMPRSENHRTFALIACSSSACRSYSVGAVGVVRAQVAARFRFWFRVWTIRVAISSTDRDEESITGIRLAAYSSLARRSSQRHCSAEA